MIYVIIESRDDYSSSYYNLLFATFDKQKAENKLADIISNRDINNLYAKDYSKKYMEYENNKAAVFPAMPVKKTNNSKTIKQDKNLFEKQMEKYFKDCKDFNNKRATDNDNFIKEFRKENNLEESFTGEYNDHEYTIAEVEELI